MKLDEIVLSNTYIVRAMPKTKAKGFDTLKVGDIITISLPLSYGRGRSLYGMYPLINGVACSSVSMFIDLMNKGMVLEEWSDDDYDDLDDYDPDYCDACGSSRCFTCGEMTCFGCSCENAEEDEDAD